MACGPPGRRPPSPHMIVSSPLRCLLALVLAASPVLTIKAANLVENADFEAGEEGWSLMVPPESDGLVDPLNYSTDIHHEGSTSAATTSNGPARYALCPKKAIEVKPGQRYRLTAWVYFADDALLERAAPGAYIRGTVLNESKSDVKTPPEHLHIGLKGDVVNSGAFINELNITELPKGWQKIEGVIEIPEGVSFLAPHLFVHGAVGTVYWDDVKVEKVPSTIPLSRVISGH